MMIRILSGSLQLTIYFPLLKLHAYDWVTMLLQKHEHILNFVCIFPTMQIAKFGLSYFMIFPKRHHPDNRAEIDAML